MTTIVWKAPGILACDKMATYDGVRYRGSHKMREGGSSVYAVCGVLAVGLATIDWIEGGCEGPCPLTEDGETVVVAMNKITGAAVSWEYPGVPIPFEDKLFAIGSGGKIALGALSMGATPEEAVKVAAEWDEGTGFGVQVAYSERAKRLLRRKQVA